MRKRSPTFASSDALVWADLLGQRYSVRPSTLLDVGDDPYACFLVDQAACLVALEREKPHEQPAIAMRQDSRGQPLLTGKIMRVAPPPGWVEDGMTETPIV